jgi:carbamoyl-phosphate synthase large subunit
MNDREVNILFTSSGRRVALLKQFKEAYAKYGFRGKMITADLKNTAPTAYFCDKHYLVPRVTADHYIDSLLAICEAEKIDLIVPLIDTELVLLARNRRRFDERNVKLLLSSLELNEIAFDKWKTYRFFAEHRIAAPKVYSEEEIAAKQYHFPLFIKPFNGSSSQGAHKIENETELNFFRSYIPGSIVQEFVSGDEYTVDVMLDFQGRIRTIVPRKRIETRAGEVSKGITRKDPAVIEAVKSVVEKLPGPAGCITIQCFKKADGDIVFIEINPRFGGGIPLSIAAGANFPLWTMEIALGRTFAEEDWTWQDGYMMLRYDDAVFMKEEAMSGFTPPLRGLIPTQGAG